MSNLDWHVIGGHHHGERHVYDDGRETLRLPEYDSVFEASFPAGAAPEGITLKSHQYRHGRLYSKRHAYHVWVPDNVSQEEAMGHILRLALADTAKGGTAHFKCAARAGNTGAGDPQDCDWPVCGCDPHADKVIEALEESGHLVHRDAKP